MADYKTLIVSQDDGLLTVVLNRPDKMNAVDPQMLEDLSAVFGDAGTNDDVRCTDLGIQQMAIAVNAILESSGKRVFRCEPVEDEQHIGVCACGELCTEMPMEVRRA